jgi:hypothetical protein
MEGFMDANTRKELSIAYLKRFIAAQEERIIAGLLKGVDTAEMEDRLHGDLAVLRRMQRETSSNRQVDRLYLQNHGDDGYKIDEFHALASSRLSSRANNAVL